MGHIYNLRRAVADSSKIQVLWLTLMSLTYECEIINSYSVNRHVDTRCRAEL